MIEQLKYLIGQLRLCFLNLFGVVSVFLASCSEIDEEKVIGTVSVSVDGEEIMWHSITRDTTAFLGNSGYQNTILIDSAEVKITIDLSQPN